jgi:hypothetical protein
MASRGTSFGKRERDRAKKEKQTLKAEKKVERAENPDDPDAGPVSTRSTEDILAEVEALHSQLDEGMIDAEDFADKREELMAQIAVD